MGEKNREIQSASGVLDPNGGLEGPLKRRFVENQDRNWARKVRFWDREKQEKELKESEEEAKKKAKQKADLAAAKAAEPVAFQPTSTAMVDPKAYFAQFQQFVQNPQA